MTLSKTCKACGEAKAIDDYERLPSGGHRGTCITCRLAANAANKRRARQKREARPEHQAKLVQQRLWNERAAERRAERKAERRAEMREAARLERQEREATLRDDLWSAMRRGRATRAAAEVKPRRTATHHIRQKLEGGYISLVEMACRVAEREACYRAVSRCKTYEAAAAAVGILEQGTPPAERAKALRKLWRGKPELTAGALQEFLEEPEESPFEEAFGDWAPAWMGTAPQPSTYALAA